MAIKTIDPNTLSLPDLQHYLQSAVAPRPIAFVSSVDAEGNINLSPFSFFNMFSTNPPILVFSPSRRVRGNTTKHTHDNVLEHAEVSINIVNFPMVEQMSLASTEYERGVNEFIKAGFTQVPSTLIQPPRVAEAPVSFECKVLQVVPLGTEGGAGNLVICQVLLMHIREEYLGSDGKLDTNKLDLVARMGGNWYCRATPDAIFEIPKPLLTRGIGVDALPEKVRNSAVLTGNNLGRLGNIENLPDAATLAEMAEKPEVIAALKQGYIALHRLAQQYIEAGKTEDALKMLLLEV